MAASGPTKCLFCYQAKPSFTVVQERVGARFQYMCHECKETEKFTVANLITKLKDNGIEEGVDMESIREMAFIKPYKIPEVPADVSSETLGFLILEKCLICDEKIKQNVNYCALEKHNEDKHADEIDSAILKKCNGGCGRLRKRIGIENHKKKSCGKFCPYKGCMKHYLLTEDHFKSVHKPVFCPFNACRGGFLPGNIESICSHIVTEHLYRFSNTFCKSETMKTKLMQKDTKKRFALYARNPKEKVKSCLNGCFNRFEKKNQQSSKHTVDLT